MSKTSLPGRVSGGARTIFLELATGPPRLSSQRAGRQWRGVGAAGGGAAALGSTSVGAIALATRSAGHHLRSGAIAARVMPPRLLAPPSTAAPGRRHGRTLPFRLRSGCVRAHRRRRPYSEQAPSMAASSHVARSDDALRHRRLVLANTSRRQRRVCSSEVTPGALGRDGLTRRGRESHRPRRGRQPRGGDHLVPAPRLCGERASSPAELARPGWAGSAVLAAPPCGSRTNFR